MWRQFLAQRLIKPCVMYLCNRLCVQVRRYHYREESTNLLEGKTKNTAGCGPQRKKMGGGMEMVKVSEERIDGEK